MTVYRGAGSPKTLPTRVLADALSETSNGLTTLILSKFKIGSRSEVEQLARGLKARVGSLNTLMIDGIVLDVEDKTGFLDHILLALAHVPGEPRSQLSVFRLTCVEAASNEASVVSPAAFGAFFVERRAHYYYLNNLGLNVNHCEAMAQELARVDPVLRPINILDLTGNPSIGQDGNEALLGLLNRRFDIRYVVVDDMSWKTIFDLVLHMNIEPQRGRFLENGVFASKAIWMNFLAELSLYRNWREAQQLNAIWYTLREDPAFICT
jgi:hypothetical protein